MADKKTLELQIKLAAEQAANQIKNFSEDIKTASQNAEGLKINQKSVNSMVKSLQTEANRAANSLKLFGGSTSELRNQQSKMKQTVLDLIDHGLKPESMEVQNLVQQYKNLDTELSKTEAKQDGLFGVINKLKNEMGSLATVAAAVALDKALAGAAKGALEVSDSFRGAKEEFGIMLGDMQAGAGLFDELQKFNFWTPFDIEQTSQAAKVLMAAKVPLGEITDYLTRFGDIAQGDEQKFQSFINAFSKASAKGKADMEVLNVYIDQGVQILDALAEQMGITTAEVVDFSSKGKISFEQFDQALASLAAEGGLYYNSMATAAMRLSSVQAGLEESVKSLKASIGDMLAPIVAKILELFTNIVDKINDSPLLKGILLGAISALTVAINAMAFKALVALVANTKAATIVLGAFGTTLKALQGPLGWITLAIGAVVGVTATLVSKQQKANEEANAAALALKKQAQGYDEVKKSAEDYLNYMNDLSILDAKGVVSSYENVLIPSAKSALEKAQEILKTIPEKIEVTKKRPVAKGRYESYTEEVENPEYTKALKEVNRQQQYLDNYTTLYNQALKNVEQLEKRAADAVVSFGTEWQDKLSSETAKIDEQEQKALNKLNAKAKETLGQNYATHEAYQKELSALEQYYNQKRQEEADKAAALIEKRQQEETEKQKRELEKRQNLIQNAQQTVTNILLKGQNQEKLLKLEYSKQLQDLKAAGDYLKQEGLFNDKEYAEAEMNLIIKLKKELAAVAISEHELRMKNAKEEYEYRAAHALNEIEDGNRSFSNYGDFAANETMLAISNTDLGQTLMGADPLSQLITAFIDVAIQIESVANVINWAGTIVKNIMNVVEPLIDTLFKPFSDVLIQLGQTIGTILAPLLNSITVFLGPLMLQLNILSEVLNIIGKGFVWLNNKVIVPFGNKVIDIINSIIKLINKIPGVNIKTLAALKTVEINAEELAKDTAQAQQQLQKKYQLAEDAVKSQLQSQLSALKSQYELGLITRDMFESQAAKYTEKANEKTYKLEEKMKNELEKIEENTSKVIDATSNRNYLITDYKKDVAECNYMDTPRKYETTIANAEYQNTNKYTSVNVYVTGSVVTEAEITDAVYNGIAKGIQQKKYTPLPA